MILPSVCVFVLCGSFLFETPRARHLISGEQQTGRDSTKTLRFTHVEGRSQGVKSFSSKQFETTSEPEWVHGDESSATSVDESEEKNSWEYAGAGSEPHEEVSGSGEDLQEVEQPSDSNDVKNVQDDKGRGKGNVENEQGGKNPYRKKKRLLATKLKDNNNDDDRELGAENLRGPGKDLADDVEQEDDSNDGQRLMNDYPVRTWVKESAGDRNQKNVQGGPSSHINGPINNSYVTHVVESTGDKEQTEDEEGGGDLSSKRFDESDNAYNLVKPTYDEDKTEEKEGDSSSRNLNTNVVANVLESTSRDKDHAEQGEEKGIDSKSRDKDQAELEDEEGSDSNSRNLNTNVVANVLESTSRDKDQAEQGEEKGSDSKSRDKDQAELEDEEGRDSNNRNLNTNVVTNALESTSRDKDQAELEEGSDSNSRNLNTNVVANVLESTSRDKNHAEQGEEKGIDSKSRDKDQAKLEDEEGSDSNSRNLNTNVVANVLESTSRDKDQAEQGEEKGSDSKSRDKDQAELEDEEGRDSNNRNLNTNVVPTNILESETEEERKDSNSATLSNNAVAQILESSRVTKDPANNEEQRSDGEKRHDTSPTKDVVKSQDDKAPENERDSSSNDNTAATHIVKSTQDKHREKPHDKGLKDVVKSKNDKALKNPSSKYYDDNNAAVHIVKSTRDKDQEGEEEERSESDGEKLYNAPKDVVKSKTLENEKGPSNKYSDENAVAQIVKSTTDKDQEEDEEERSESDGEKLHNAPKDVVKSKTLENEKGPSNKYPDENTVAHIVKSTRDKDQEEDEEDKNKMIHDQAVVHLVESTDDEAGGNDIVQSARDKDGVEIETGSDSENRKLQNDVVTHDLERTGKAEYHVANDVRKDDNSKSTPYVSHLTESPGGKDQTEERKYSRSENMVEASGDSNQAEVSENYPDASTTKKLIDDKKETEEAPMTNENQDITPGDEYDYLDLLSSGEQSFSDGSQLELASLISPKPGKEGRVARTKIYKPENQDKLLEDQDDKDIQDAAEVKASPEKFNDYVADDSEQENLHPEDDEEENATGRDWVQSARKVKDWGDSERFGAKDHSLEHSQKTQEILANLEDEIYNDGKNEKTKQTNYKKRTQKAHMKLKLHQSRVVHKPHIHEKISKFSSSGIIPPVMTPVLFPVVSTILPTTKFTYYELSNAQKKGAVCIDGSTPGYYFRKGFGDGESNWIIYLQGGAWCESKESCLERSTTYLGSSHYFKDVENPGGLLSGDHTDNPTFFNWNVVYLPYCDGSSFAGNRSDPVEVEGEILYFRGKRILSAAMDDLLKSGMQHAQEILLSGTSAGGLAVMLHNDYIRNRLPTKVHLHSLADSGFFLDIPTRQGKDKFRKAMQNVFKLHDCTSGVNQKCVSSMSAKDLWKCIFPQYFLPFVKSPLYLVNPIFDSWQLENVYHVHCAYHVDKCTKEEKMEIGKFGQTAMDALTGAVHSAPAVQMYADACVDHGQVISSLKWNSIKVRNMSISGAFTKWYKNANKKTLARSVVESRVSQISKKIFIVNPTCV